MGKRHGNRMSSTYKWLSTAIKHERTIPTERPPLVGEVSTIFFRLEGATWSA
jgi:hypothetical protein